MVLGCTGQARRKREPLKVPACKLRGTLACAVGWEGAAGGLGWTQFPALRPGLGVGSPPGRWLAGRSALNPPLALGGGAPAPTLAGQWPELLPKPGAVESGAEVPGCGEGVAGSSRGSFACAPIASTLLCPQCTLARAKCPRDPPAAVPLPLPSSPQGTEIAVPTPKPRPCTPKVPWSEGSEAISSPLFPHLRGPPPNQTQTSPTPSPTLRPATWLQDPVGP